MDFTPVIAQVCGMPIWFIPAALLLCLLRSPWPKGHIGELPVRLFAHWEPNKQTCRILHNVTLNTPDGTTQIHHVFLSPYGILMLETKNKSGWIFGGEKQAQWTQKLYKRTFKFQDPLRQNYKHLKAMEAVLGVNPEHLQSVITFVGDSTSKTEVQPHLTQGIGFIRYIRAFQQPVFSEAEVDAMLHVLQTDHRAPTLATHREHVQNLIRRSDPTAERNCPKYDSALVICNRKTGANVGQQFWGCSTFSMSRTMQSLRVAWQWSITTPA